MSSMRSASSITVICTHASEHASNSKSSRTRPGVPTNTSTPARSAATCVEIALLPHTTAERKTVPPRSCSASLPICCASSRVGANTSARNRARESANRFPCSLGLSARKRVAMGNKYANVFPVPVGATATMSRPVIAAANVPACTSVGLVILLRVKNGISSGSTPRVLKSCTTTG